MQINIFLQHKNYITLFFSIPPSLMINLQQLKQRAVYNSESVFSSSLYSKVMLYKRHSENKISGTKYLLKYTEIDLLCIPKKIE